MVSGLNFEGHIESIPEDDVQELQGLTLQGNTVHMEAKKNRLYLMCKLVSKTRE